MNALRIVAATLAVSAALHAASLRGLVVEAQTGKPLARALVVVQPVAGSKGATQSIRTNTSGVFQFPAMAAGAYLVTGSRRAFAPLEYGQKGWKSAGVPVVLDEANETVLRIALPRYGAITGRIVDENDVGLAEHDVIAYRNTRPPVPVAKAATDDRGVYRIFGLEPGAYVVRTATKIYDDGGYLPTFYKDAVTMESARLVEVVLDTDVPDITIRPTPGRLYNVAGNIYGVPGSRVQTTVTLVSDMGSESVSADGNGTYKFSPVAPGKYELFATTYAGRQQGIWTAYQPLEIDRDQTSTNLSMRAEPEVQFFFEDTKGAAVDSSLVQLMARQKQLSGDGAVQYLRPVNNRMVMLPGRWDFGLAPNYAYYVASFSGPNRETKPGERADGWNEVAINGANPIVKFVLSGNPAAIHGVVSKSDGAKAAGAPVFLETRDVAGRQRLGELRTTRTDVNGNFQFTGLPPGNYRIVSTFEYQNPDDAAMSGAGAIPIKLEEGVEIAQNLLLQVAR